MIIDIQIQIVNDTVRFKAGCDGRPLNRLEMAYQLNKIAAGLIKDGIKENGLRMVIPAGGDVLNITAQG